jgi:hypothetical protein
MGTFFVVYFSSIIILGFIFLGSYIFFHIKYSYVIIDLLKENGFIELSNKMSQLISTGGRLPAKSSLEAKPLSKAWNEFIKLKITKDSGKLYKLQYFYKTLRLTLIIYAIIFSIPFLLFYIIYLKLFR